jgi:hypothetical protein
VIWILYILTVAFSLVYFVHDNWASGHDLDVETLLHMGMVALIPILNIIVVFAIWEPWTYFKMDRVLLKGKNDSPDL